MSSKLKIPLAPVERMLKKQGAQRVSKKSAEAFAEVLEDITADIAAEALKMAKHAGRKTVKAEDVKLARKRGFS